MRRANIRGALTPRLWQAFGPGLLREPSLSFGYSAKQVASVEAVKFGPVMQLKRSIECI